MRFQIADRGRTSRRQHVASRVGDRDGGDGFNLRHNFRRESIRLQDDELRLQGRSDRLSVVCIPANVVHLLLAAI